MINLKNFLYLIKCDLMYFVSKIIPKNKDLWVFGAWFGERYSDNPKYLFEYINYNHPEIKAVWLTKNKDVNAVIKSKGFRVYDACSLKGIIMSMTAKCCIITHNLYDINEFACSKIKIAQVRRGTPFLKISGNYEKIQRANTETGFPFFEKNIYSWKNVIVISTSEVVSDVYEKFFGMPKDKVKVTGYPRNDYFFIKNRQKPYFFDNFPQGTRFGAYAPHGTTALFEKNIGFINDELKKLNIVLLVMPYSFNIYSKNILKKGLSNVYYLKDEDTSFADFYEVLPYTDFMVTDYASVFLDYLFLDKPVIFSPLETGNDFYYDYNEVTPGQKSENWGDVIKYITQSIANPDEYSKERKTVLSKFHKYVDGQNSHRVYEEIKKWLS